MKRLFSVLIEVEMTKQALLRTLQKCAENDDTEDAHARADDALVAFIADEEIAAAYAAVAKWYA